MPLVRGDGISRAGGLQLGPAWSWAGEAGPQPHTKSLTVSLLGVLPVSHLVPPTVPEAHFSCFVGVTASQPEGSEPEKTGQAPWLSTQPPLFFPPLHSLPQPPSPFLSGSPAALGAQGSLPGSPSPAPGPGLASVAGSVLASFDCNFQSGRLRETWAGCRGCRAWLQGRP